MSALTDNIVESALKYVGQKEIPGNLGFVNKDFEAKIKAMGWTKGQSWCAYTSELVWKEAFTRAGFSIEDIDKLFSGAAVATYANFKASKKFKTGTVPKRGAVAIWQKGKTWMGHAAIVVDVLPGGKEFVSIEGNTNAAGGREGIEVARKKRKVGLPFSSTGLNLIGFVYPD